MNKHVFTALILAFVLNGCSTVPVVKNSSGNGVYQLPLSTNLDGNIYQINSQLEKILPRKTLASSSFVSRVKKNDFFSKWINRDSSKSKAIFMIDRNSCKDSYYYGSWNFKDNISALNRAKEGCDKGAQKRNELMGKDCKCRLVAFNNTFFYGADEYQSHASNFPWIMEVKEGAEVIKVKGMAELSSDQRSFKLLNDNGVESCKGSVRFNDGAATGNINIDCFNGKIIGEGEIVRKEFNKELKLYSGSAFMKTPNGEMRVIYGPNIQN